MPGKRQYVKFKTEIEEAQTSKELRGIRNRLEYTMKLSFEEYHELVNLVLVKRKKIARW